MKQDSKHLERLFNEICILANTALSATPISTLIFYNNMLTYWFVKMMANRICQSTDRIIQNQQVLVLKYENGQQMNNPILLR